MFVACIVAYLPQLFRTTCPRSHFRPSFGRTRPPVVCVRPDARCPTALHNRRLYTEALPDSSDTRESKRSFNGIGKETDLFQHLPLLDKTVVENQEVNEECVSSEDYVVGVMRSVEEEISVTFSTFCAPISGDNSSSYDIYSVHDDEALVSDSGIDLCYLLDASDDELGIPSYPILDSKDEACEPSEETFTTEGLSETPNLKW